MDTEPDAPRGPFIAEDVARVDFRDPLTREEAGLEPGGESRIYERVGDAIDVEVLLPDDRVLRTPAFGLIVSGRAGEEAPESVPELRLNVRSGTTQDVARVLVEQAPALGLDPLEVEQWAGVPDPTNQVFLSAPGTVPEASVEVRQSGNPPGTWTINYDLRHLAAP